MSKKSDNKIKNIYEHFAPKFEVKGFVAVPIKPGEKAPAMKGWTKVGALPPEERQELWTNPVQHHSFCSHE